MMSDYQMQVEQDKLEAQYGNGNDAGEERIKLCAVCGEEWPHLECTVPAVMSQILNSIAKPII